MSIFGVEIWVWNTFRAVWNDVVDRENEKKKHAMKVLARQGHVISFRQVRNMANKNMQART